jgi:hypothetical protein
VRHTVYFCLRSVLGSWLVQVDRLVQDHEKSAHMRSEELLLIADVICRFVHLFQGSFAFQLKQKFLDFSHQSGVVDLKIVNRLVVLRQALLVVLAHHVLGFLGLVQLPQRKHVLSVLFLDFPDAVVEFIELLLTALF